jgi:oligopeptide/dipeptide ABC transporter ATP-binding protein
MADEVLVMYLGRVVESGSVRAILKKPRHPYTIGLLESLPSLTPIGKRLPSIRGSVPALSDIPAGCPFHPRCAYAVVGRCNVGAPPPLEHFASASPEGGEERSVACWRTREIALERLLQRPAHGAPGSDPFAARPLVEDSAERITETAAPPAVMSLPTLANPAVANPAVVNPADSELESGWYDSTDFSSDREGLTLGQRSPDGKEPPP